MCICVWLLIIGFVFVIFSVFFFFKQKTAYEMRISDWSSDVCSSDLSGLGCTAAVVQAIPETDAVRQTPQCRGHCHCAGALRLRLGYRSPGDGHRILIKTADRSSSTFTHRRMSPLQTEQPIGRASCRERVCQYVYIQVVAVTLIKNTQKHTQN